MVVLAGKQGVRKSKLLMHLGKNWFSDSFTTVKGKEACDQLQGDPKDMTIPKAKEYNEILRNIKGWRPYGKGSGKVSFGSIYGNQTCYVREDAPLD